MSSLATFSHKSTYRQNYQAFADSTRPGLNLQVRRCATRANSDNSLLDSYTALRSRIVNQPFYKCNMQHSKIQHSMQLRDVSQSRNVHKYSFNFKCTHPDIRLIHCHACACRWLVSTHSFSKSLYSNDWNFCYEVHGIKSALWTTQ